MATLLDVYNLRYMSAYMKPRVIVAIAKAAQDILNEDPGTTNHANRVILANNSLRDTAIEAERLMWGVVGNTTIQTNGDSSSDQEIQNAVNGLIDTFATGV